MVTLALSYALVSGNSRVQFPIPLRGLGPRLAGRRSALETVEKVVTLGQAGQGGGSGWDLVLQDQRVPWNDRDHHADGLVRCGISGSDVLGYGRSSRDS